MLLFPPRVIQKIIELKPKSKYIVAVDDAKSTLEEVVKVTFVICAQKTKTRGSLGSAVNANQDYSMIY